MKDGVEPFIAGDVRDSVTEIAAVATEYTTVVSVPEARNGLKQATMAIRVARRWAEVSGRCFGTVRPSPLNLCRGANRARRWRCHSVTFCTSCSFLFRHAAPLV